jgi:hypothetical protein
VSSVEILKYEKSTAETDYTNNMRDRIMISMSQYCIENPNINFYLYPMEDTEFFKRFADGVALFHQFFLFIYKCVGIRKGIELLSRILGFAYRFIFKVRIFQKQIINKLSVQIFIRDFFRVANSML